MRSSIVSLLLLAIIAALYTPAASATELDPDRILCPVIAALYNGGDLEVDEFGSASDAQIFAALTNGTGAGSSLAQFQSNGISDYDSSQKEIQEHRHRCITGSPCWMKKKLFGPTEDTTRWLNIFKMNGLQTVEHGTSTGVRGGANNVPEFDYAGGPCDGKYPCEERFQKFYASCANDDGRFYLENINCIICKGYKWGDRTGEFAMNPTQGFRQWQMVAAMTGWLNAFGRTDEETGELYFEMEDARAMLMEGRYPDGWKKRSWGVMGDVKYAMNLVVPQCDAGSGYYDPWWMDTDCPSYTGQKCSLLKKCSGGATCISGKCLCGLGSNLVSMCAVDGACQERENKCEYFGEPCKTVPADSPKAPW